MTNFYDLFRPDLQDRSLIPQLELESETDFGLRNELFSIPAVFSQYELDELEYISSFWSQISKKIKYKLLNKDEQILTQFPELVEFNDSQYSKFEVPPLMRLDTLIDELGNPKIIECNSQFPGNIGIDSIQALNYYNRNKKASKVSTPLNSHIRFLEFLLSQEDSKLTFVETPDNELALETEFLGSELEERGVNVSYRKSDEDLSDLSGLVVKRVIPRNSQLERLVQTGNITLINPSWSYFVGNKGLFPLLRNSDFIRNFEDKLLLGIEQYIPETLYLQDLPVDRLSEVIRDKNSYVVKYPDNYGGDGVFIGDEMSTEDWTNILNSSNTKKAVLQRRINALTYQGDSFDIGVMMINGEFSNPWMRISKNGSLKTNMHGGGRSVACYKELE